MRCWLGVAGGMAVGLLACSRGASEGTVAEDEGHAREVVPAAPEPIDLRTLELDTKPADGAEHGHWARCAGGQLEGLGRRVAVCVDASQTWPDPKEDRVAFVATAAHANELDVAGKRGRFVDGRARVELPIASLGEGTVEGAERRRTIAVRVVGDAGELSGTVVLVTPVAVPEGAPGAPKRVMALAPLVRFAGFDAQTTRAALLAKLGAPTSVGPTAGGVEMIAFGPELGALIDAKTGRLAELWVVGAAGREALKKRGLDDAILALVDAPLALAKERLGPPTRTGEEFVSWALERDGLTIYLELSCEHGGDERCHELDVGWLATPPAPPEPKAP